MERIHCSQNVGFPGFLWGYRRLNRGKAMRFPAITILTVCGVVDACFSAVSDAAILEQEPLWDRMACRTSRFRSRF